MTEINKIPKHWQWKKLGEVADYLNGRAFKPTEWEKKGTPIIRIQNLNKAVSKYNYTEQEFEDKYKVVKGDLLFAWSASLGVYIWNKEKAWLNQHIFKVVPKEICDKKFLFYTLEIITADLYSKTHGSGMVHVTKGKFEETTIPFPPLKEQQLIVSKIEELLSDLENGKQQLETAQQQLKVYRQSLLKWAFQGRLTNKNINGTLPKKWKWATIGDVCKNVEYGSATKSKKVGSVPVLRMGNIQNGKFDWGDLVFTDNQEEIKKYLLRKNDVLFNRTNSAELVGKTAIYSGERPAIFAGYLIRINRIDSLVDANYLTYFLNSHFAKSYGETVRSFGVNQSNINGTKLKTYPLPLPPLEEQQRIVEELQSKLTVCDTIEETISQSLQQALMLRQSILKKAFEGKLVPTAKMKTAQTTLTVGEDVDLMLALLVRQIEKELKINYGEVVLQKTVFNCTIEEPNSIKNYQFVNSNFGTYSFELRDDLKKNIYLEKKRIKGKEVFAVKENYKKLLDKDLLNRKDTNFTNSLNQILALYKTAFISKKKEKIELLNTVFKAILDTRSIQLNDIRKAMGNWKTPKAEFKTKADKFTEAETAKCLQFVREKGWDKKLIK